MNKLHTLVIRHMPDSDPPEFQVAREDQKTSEPAQVVSPFGFPVEGRPKSGLMRELRWYLEDFLEYPFPPNTDHADNVLVALDKWGKKAFNELFDGGMARDFFRDATNEGYQNLRLQIMSDDPTILQWPWEALLDEQAAYLSVTCQIERRLNKVRDPVAIPDDLPKDRINILLVTARPYENDVGYRSISRPLVELIDKQGIRAHAHVLRPPTFENLRRHLKDRPHFYHIIHFDGHGGYGTRSTTGGNQHQFQGPEGVLVFEDEKGEESPVTAEQLSGLLREHAVPVMVLNACRSAMLGPGAEDPFASVAAALLKAGIRSVVAMAYSLYVSGAQEFLPDFYRELFESGDLSVATRAGRQKMYERMGRVCARGKYDLKDFVVPVIYAQEQYNLSFAADALESEVLQKIELPEEAKDEKNPYGFIGRDRELLKLERAMRKDTPAILIHGLGGVGKTTLARGFVKWLRDTEGMDACRWFKFVDIRSAESVINSMGGPLLGTNFLAAPMEQRIEELAQVLRENRLVIVWDNFEVAAGIPGTYISANLSAEDQKILLKLLEKIRGGRSKVIITSRSEEQWLGIQRLKVSIGGLVGEEMWEYCEKILDGLNLRVDRTDKDQVELMDLLNGHPLAMRVILPRLENMSARQVIDAVRSNMEALGPDAEELYATLQFAVEQLDEELKLLLIPLAFHEGFADANFLEHMGEQVGEEWSRGKTNAFFPALAAAGLARNVAADMIYELYPALTGFLRSTLLKSISQETRDTWSHAFVDIMARVANQVAPLELHEQRMPLHFHGANFRHALSEAERLQMETGQAALTESLASYAKNTRNFSEASELFKSLAKAMAKVGNEEGEAAVYYELGMIALELRDFATAEKWCLKSLAITEKHSIEHGAASIYHQLGMIAEARRDFATAEKWYMKSLAIKEKHGNEHGAATTYHQLGIIAQQQRNFSSAEKWYMRAVEIFEKHNTEHRAAMTYHQLGRIALELHDFATAEKWYMKSLAIEKKHGNEHGAASTYHQLGMNAQQQRDFVSAEKWYMKALAIEEKLGAEHHVASTYGELGILAGVQGYFEEGGRWLIKSIRTFACCRDHHLADQCRNNFMISYKKAPSEIQAKLKTMWEEAGLGPLPEIGSSAPSGVTSRLAAFPAKLLGFFRRN